MTQLVAQFLPPQYQAYFFVVMLVIYVAGNAIFPFLSKYKFNGWEHMLWMAFQDLRVDKTTQQVEFKIPDDQMQEIKCHMEAAIGLIAPPLKPSVKSLIAGIQAQSDEIVVKPDGSAFVRPLSADEAVAVTKAIPKPVQAPAPVGVAAIITNNSGGTTMKTLIGILMLTCIGLMAGCSATNQAAFQADCDKVLAVIQQINATTTTVVMNDGPIAVAILCTAAPGDCPAAQGALALAQATQLELNNLTKTAQAVNAAPNTAKVSTAVGSILANFDQINGLIKAYGGKPVDITPIQAALVALPPPLPTTAP